MKRSDLRITRNHVEISRVNPSNGELYPWETLITLNVCVDGLDTQEILTRILHSLVTEQ